jgi:hypothetical protein
MSGSNTGRKSHFKRRRRRGSYLGVTGKFPSQQNAHSLFYESLRERDLFVLLAFQQDVVHVEDHPFTIDYRSDGRQRHYTPDALVRYAKSQKDKSPDDVVEVKVTSELIRKAAEYEKVFTAAKEHCTKQGSNFRVATEEQLRRPMVRNLRFLFPYRAFPSNAAAEREIRRNLAKPRSLTEICDRLAKIGIPPDETISQVWRLVALQHIAVDLDAPLSMQSLLEGRSWSTKL